MRGYALAYDDESKERRREGKLEKEDVHQS